MAPWERTNSSPHAMPIRSMMPPDFLQTLYRSQSRLGNGFAKIKAVATNSNVNGNRCSRFAPCGLRVTIALDDGRAAMRWCVSIGAVLVAGTMAGGDVAGFAAPNPRTTLAAQFADKETAP